MKVKKADKAGSLVHPHTGSPSSLNLLVTARNLLKRQHTFSVIIIVRDLVFTPKRCKPETATLCSRV